MELEYDQKFEEMKKYIPFLESMIKRLESTSNGVNNPRKAQLDKIRSLRDLLSDKKKRMKMENLLKCEQVLVNLYAKVEQRDSMADTKDDCTEQTEKEKCDLNIVRNKLKSVVSKLQDHIPETLPEIARATNTEVVCTPGSKEPALFQRRPNKASPHRQLPSKRNDDDTTSSSSSKRHYTRVLMSPEHKKKEWLTSSDNSTEKPLFSRRSPRRSPRRHSPSFKRERKKTPRQRSKSRQNSKDLNITLKVPEESLGSLNTKDILSRIINCNDNDVDIDTLRGIRSQILGELKQTGSRDDISDLILKSYKKKEQSKKKDEIEEGELSDSESEAIENIYGSLVVVDEDEAVTNINKPASDKKHPRKIQICLVINSEKEKDSTTDGQKLDATIDLTDFEPSVESKNTIKAISDQEEDKNIDQSTGNTTNQSEKDMSLDELKRECTTQPLEQQPKEKEKSVVSATETFKPNFYQPVKEDNTLCDKAFEKQSSCKNIVNIACKEDEKSRANQPHEPHESKEEKIDREDNESVSKPIEVATNERDSKSSVVNIKSKKVTVSEIDILQALKKEILSETSLLPICETITPLMHQPKITKVASTQEIVPKKRISIEKYKQKSIPSKKQPLFIPTKKTSLTKDDISKKQSLKLTEKECERFNFPVDLSPVTSSDDEDRSIDFEFLVGNSAPKSPDHEDFADAGIKPPVIIPSDPVKNVVASTKADIDMRTLIPLISPVTLEGSKKKITSLSNDKLVEATRNVKCNINEMRKKPVSELQTRTESNPPSGSDSQKSFLMDSDRLSRPSVSYQNVPSTITPNIASSIPALMSLNTQHMTPALSPNMVSSLNPILAPILNSNVPLLLNPNMAPNMLSSMNSGLAPNMIPNMNPSMTPSRMLPCMNPLMTPILTPNARSYEMTPRPNFDHDDYMNQKHVYAPIFPTFESHDFLEKDPLNQGEANQISWEDRNPHSTSTQRDIDFHINRNDRFKGNNRIDSPQSRMDCPSTPNPSFGRTECPATPNPSFGRIECPSTPNPSFGRMECPPTPNPSFGRMECPPTPNPSFGRMECPPTPNPSFGRMECPPTPNPSFGRVECPPTPNPPYVRMETPMTPVHSFGRTDCNMTPSHSFGRSEPNMTPTNTFGRGDFHHKAPNFSQKYTKSYDPRLNRSSDFDKYKGRSDDRNRSYFEDDRNLTDNKYRRSQVKSYEQVGRGGRGRESSVGRSLTRDYDTNESYGKDCYNNDYYYRREKYKHIDDVHSRRERNRGRMSSSEDSFSTQRERSRTYTRENSIEKPLSVQSHTGRSFNIDTSFNRTFQDSKSLSLSTAFDIRRRRASSVGRSLRESPGDDFKPTSTKTIKIELDVPERRTLHIRRACSVGRELKDYDADKNFNDIKEDLRSYKFSNWDFKLQDIGNREQECKSQTMYSNEKGRSNESHNSPHGALSQSNEYQLNRDPRRKIRDCDQNINKYDLSKYSPRNNYRDPRMRREMDVRNISKHKDYSNSRYKYYGIVYSNDNIAKGTILASAAGVKNFKIPKIKRPAEQKVVEINNKLSKVDTKKEGSIKNANEKSSKADYSGKGESKPTKSALISDKCVNLESNENVAKTDKSKSRKGVIVKIEDEAKSQEHTDLVSETCDKRITRSANKSGTLSRPIRTTSLVRKLRRIKKPFVYDSDSASDVNDSDNASNKNIEESKNMQTKDLENLKKNVAVENEENVEEHFNMQHSTNNSKNVELKECMTENITSDESSSEYTLVRKEKPVVDVIRNELCEEQSDSLDISFGVDDELFSDNIGSESVLDNINALIADLDHDIEAPKINDFNDKFINNIVGNISPNDSVPLDVPRNKPDFANNVTMTNESELAVQNDSKCTNVKIPVGEDNSSSVEVNEITDIPECVNPENSGSVQNKSNEIKDKVIESEMTLLENSDENVFPKSIDKSEIQIETKNQNIDAIVSTTANDGKNDENSVVCYIPLLNDVANYTLVPDSTNNSQDNNVPVTDKYIEETESFPDSTNEYELNNEILTHNSRGMSCKEQPNTNSNNADSIPQIDSISNFLSILEDKKKIKELLSMLGNDSGDNEKLKKKLEKLSEIVSDDEDNLGEGKKNRTAQEDDLLIKETDEKGINVSSDKVEISDSNNKSNDDIKNHDKQLDEEKVSISKTTQNYNETLCTNDVTINNDENQFLDQSTVVIGEESFNHDEDLTANQLFPIHTLNENKSTVEIVSKHMVDDDIGDGGTEKQVIVKKPTDNVEDLQENINQGIIDKDLLKDKKEFDVAVTKSPQLKTGKKIAKKSKLTKKGRSRLAKKLLLNKDKRVTRCEADSSEPQVPLAPKKPSRELLKLQEDIRDMFISEDILNATGIRMCRLAKLGNETKSKSDLPPSDLESAEPIVLLENINTKISSDESLEKINKTRTPKNKPNAHNKATIESGSKGKLKYKPGPKSKTKRQEDDPYFFETDSIGESNCTEDIRDQNTASESDSVSTKSFESSELLVEVKKRTKRKKRSWHLGVIRKKGVKSKSAAKEPESPVDASDDVQIHKKNEKPLLETPDLDCFTDKSYCFYKNVKIYLCRLCAYRGKDIVPHYKKHHPHSEIPLSRLNTETSKEAIQECENMNLQAISKIQTTKYTCRFCFQEFHKQNSALETFFWHVVSAHTGEYKHLCSECLNVTRCPFNLDIPPPPKNLKGQLIGYICGRCNFTQVSLENLKTHVIIRHDDEQTEVYSINLGDIPKNLLKSLIKKVSEPKNTYSLDAPRILRSTRSNQSITEPSDDCSDITEGTDLSKLDTTSDELLHERNVNDSGKVSPKSKIQSKLIFENDDLGDTSSYSKTDETIESIESRIKLERDDDRQDSPNNDAVEDKAEPVPDPESEQGKLLNDENANTQNDPKPSTDVLNCPHFKIKLSNTGSKEYVCCINGIDNHYKTTLLISFKKHVQLKHPENWDGYCFVCKVIVTGQGKHTFKDCLQHFLDKHMDDFPILEDHRKATANDEPKPHTFNPTKDTTVPKPFINVRPLSELIASEQSEIQEGNSSMPKIQSVISLGASNDSINFESKKDEVLCNYEETQVEVMTKKHRVVLETMLNSEKLIQVFKCAGRFCSYTSNNAEEALLHASTHQKIGGENSLKCAYCNFDSSGNAIDLVMHVFKNYNHCSYACSKCFYRAAASQLVYAHIKRVHTESDPDKIPILSSATAVKDTTKDDLISRDAAVLYYICNNRDPEDGGVCQFKSYILTKFLGHLQTRHANDQEFSCYMCNVSTSSSKLLASHLKGHGLRIYQCCRCLFGADNETDLMAHASEKHPFKQPKAYLRIITSKGGSSEVRVLPLAVLSKSSVQATIVTPSIDRESPVKQAERSIDLEKLIGEANFMIDSMSTETNPATIEPVEVIENETQIEVESEQASCSNFLVEPDRASPATLTLLQDSLDNTNKLDIVVKCEPIDTSNIETRNETVELSLSTPTLALPELDVVCLDSDEDISRQNIIDLSDDDTPSETTDTKKEEDGSEIKIPRSRLYKCSKCYSICKSEGMFKRHIMSCFPDVVELTKCAYCKYSTNASRIVIHYNTVHLENTMPYNCAICNGKFISLAVAKKHMKLVHNQASTVLTSKTSPNGSIYYIIETNAKERQASKRKLSGDASNKNLEPANKLKKYGPEDIDKLPINPILDNLVYCSLCEFNTKVRLNMVRHLQMHAEQQPVPRTTPVNPVPHLESNEKHFDKMLNLASSSIITSNKTSKDGAGIAAEQLSPEAAALYPKYVSERHRYTCGARECSYISVNESIFKIHWETLHAGTYDYHCVHCPPHQHLDTSKPLTAVRIIAHLKMHDVKLYACSSCTFYHYTRKIVEKHLKEVHNGKLIIVREDGAAVPLPPSAPSQSATTPTMDLKPWQCGLCAFKSRLCPEVIEHCGKFHQSKMQFKCIYCGFRTSNIENISKHQAKQHPGNKEEVFYFYYREGSIPDEPDGTTRWQKQSQKNDSQVNTEKDVTAPEAAQATSSTPMQAKPSNAVNLDIVKKEVLEPEAHTEETIEDICKELGQFCEPNGLNYKCSLCKIVTEDTREAMQFHLFEELQYRKWGCSVCSYKAFHKPGLQQHVQTEHGQSREAREPVELQVDQRIETWVSKLLDHQTAIIERNKENLAKQKAEILRANPGATASNKVAEKPAESPKVGAEPTNVTMATLEKLFGSFGVPSHMNYSCPKCNISARSEAVMQEHLETELNKIRWCCSSCSETFQTYHEAQFHCRSVHQGLSTRPVEATRNVGLRAAWVSAALRIQKLSMNYRPVTDSAADTPAQPVDNSPEDSLLVVRYEEKVPTPEEQMKLNKKSNTDGEKDAKDESERKKTVDIFTCKYCTATYKSENFFQNHILKHYGLKPFCCAYCSHTDQRKAMELHIITDHVDRPVLYFNTPIPTTPPSLDNVNPTTSSTSRYSAVEIDSMSICLVCEEAMTKAKSLTHMHDGVRPQFANKGSVVYRCWVCMTLHKTFNDFNLHHKQNHAKDKKSTSLYKIHEDTMHCALCKQYFSTFAAYRTHHQMVHGFLHIVSHSTDASDVIEVEDDSKPGTKRKAEDTTILPVAKRVARKSTTKLPLAMAVARKSTTKLPHNVPSDTEEYSYYGTKPSMDNLHNVTTLMPFCNTFVPFTLEKLNEIIKIYPYVVVKDINDKK